MSELIDISFLTSFYRSSRSDWEQYRVGSPIDGACTTERFSVHTEEEIDPFVVFSIPLNLETHSVRLNLRAKYAKRCFPISVEARSSDGWFNVGIIREVSDFYVFDIKQKVSDIRIQSVGLKALDFSSLNIYVEREKFCESTERYASSLGGLVFAYTDFYGLGGKLSVIASALGYLGAQSNQKNIFCDKSLGDVLAYPKAYAEGKDNLLDEVLEDWSGKAVVDFIKTKSYKGKKNISLFFPVVPRLDEAQKFTFISRNKLEWFSYDGESPVSLKQRLYKRMIPSAAVVEHRNELGKKYPFDGHRSVGVHLRHGNGELYYREFDDFNRWGVKPPSINLFVESIESLIYKDKSIKSLVVCSDSFAVRDLLEQKFGDELNVVFISEGIQDVGCGCNHTPKVFDSRLKRVDVDRSTEDCDALSEMLLLSTCRYLVGGSSFFFDAVIGFSNCEDEKVIQFDNKDRYARLPKNVVPISTYKDEEVRGKFDLSDILIDGVFIFDDDSGLQISYFDEYIASFCSKDVFMDSSLEEVREFLKARRGY